MLLNMTWSYLAIQHQAAVYGRFRCGCLFILCGNTFVRVVASGGYVGESKHSVNLQKFIFFVYEMSYLNWCQIPYFILLVDFK